MLERVFLLSLVISLAACGGNILVDAAGSTTGGTSTSGVGGAATTSSSSQASSSTSGMGGAATTSSSGAGGAPACLKPGLEQLPAVPSALKVCNTAADCMEHDVIVCCGGLAVAFAAAETAAFKAYAAACFHPALCNCAGPLHAEDGKTGNIQLECAGGLGMTYVP